MRFFLCLIFALGLSDVGLGAENQLAQLHADLQHLAVDPTQTYRVRELEIAKGGVKFYLTEGVLAFATAVDGHRIAAVYTVAPVEAGDGEVISLPPVAAERASLARFTNSPNLDEHVTSALLFFGDDTAADLLRQIHERPTHPAPELAAEIEDRFGGGLRSSAAEMEVRISQSILDRHGAQNSFFYGMLAGRTLGTIDFIYQPDQPDAMIFGRVAQRAPGGHTDSAYFQIWSAFRLRAMPRPALVYHLTDYHIDTTIRADLSMKATADFDYQADSDDGSVISLFMTPRLRPTAATIDGEAAAVVIHDSPRNADVRGAINFLLASGTELAAGSHHRVRIQYEGTVIRRTAAGAYFVDDRNAWYPLMMPMLTEFDLTFHCPENLRLVSTGDLVSEEVSHGERTVHRRTMQTQALAGFNLGEFTVATAEHPPYRVAICSNPQQAAAPNLDAQAAAILEYFSALWRPLTGRDVSITPIEGYFGQGFPGLIYLSSISYLQEKDRPHGLRNASLDSFFSRLLLPHELAHQWWGNVVTAADYRSNWIVEAMSNYSALQYLEQVDGPQAMNDILAEYREDLIRAGPGGELVDSYGPVTFDQRLENNFGTRVWHDVLYEKGTWIFHMLRQRMGARRFHDFQLQVLKDFARRPISNEDLRAEAAQFIPAQQPDRTLTAFFDTWVYDTGIPTLRTKGGTLVVSGVSDSYTVDIPLACGAGTGSVWTRANSGEMPLPGRSCGLPERSHFLFKD
jgi:hypothetical protein